MELTKASKSFSGYYRNLSINTYLLRMVYIECNVKGIPNSWSIEWIICHIRYHISNVVITPTPQASLMGSPNCVHHASLTFGGNT